MPNVGDIIHPGGEFRDPGTTLKALIAEAHDIKDEALYLLGLPKWAEANVYSVVAKAGPEYAITNSQENREAVKAMLRSFVGRRSFPSLNFIRKSATPRF